MTRQENERARDIAKAKLYGRTQAEMEERQRKVDAYLEKMGWSKESLTMHQILELNAHLSMGNEHVADGQESG